MPELMLGAAIIDLSAVSFDAILDEVKGVITVAIPVVISFIAVRKGISFLKGQLKGA